MNSTLADKLKNGWPGILVFLTTLATYLATMEPSASYWDCPEYILVAYGLQNGHPPGNPLWTLQAHIATFFATDVQHVAACVNVTSCLFAALTVWLLYLTTRILLAGIEGVGRTARELAAVIAALAYCWSDSFWFSAVEAEVYAMSTFFTALMFWLMLLWARTPNRRRADRLLLLLAYLSGLTIGVHQLNLLILPVLALVAARRWSNRPHPVLLTCLLLAASLLGIAMLLFGMMTGTIALASQMELLAVNDLGMAWNSGVVVYLSLLLICAVTAIWLASKVRSRWLQGLGLALLLFTGGFFSFNGNLWLGAGLSIFVCAILVIRYPGRRAMLMAAWGASLALTGFSVYALVMIRGIANPPINTGQPDNIFALGRYLARDQYGEGAPLLYGPTLFSQTLKQETLTLDSAGKVIGATYGIAAVANQTPKYMPYMGAGPTKGDSLLRPGKYHLAGYRKTYRTSPETNMVFPRMYNTGADNRDGYMAWSGADSASMRRVAASYAVDSAGNAVGRFNIDSGLREKDTLLMPTVWQNATYFLGYQVGYMYLRYLMWNFSGRQSDVLAGGEMDAGNFLTGIPMADDAMSGGLNLLPREIGRDNPGHNRFFMIPFIIGLVGIFWQAGRRGRDLVILLALFLMMGLAIVVYLNQTPGEPRDRDYSFLSSFYVWCIWVAMGVLALSISAGDIKGKAGKWLRPVLMWGGLALPFWMLAVNLDDHNRAHRHITPELARNELKSCPEGALFLHNGDNYSFPLWYLQEVEGERADVRLLNYQYLQTPWYIRQLAIGTHGAKPVLMTGTPEDYAYGYYGVVRYDTSPMADTLDAVEALTDMFRRGREGGAARLGAGWLRLAPPQAGQDSLVVRLATLAHGSGTIQQKDLAMLDIIATNASLGWPRAIVINPGMSDDHCMGLSAYYRCRGAVKYLAGDTLVAKEPDLDALRQLVPSFRFGGGDSHPEMYIDYISRKMLLTQRRALLWQTHRLLENGDVDAALQIVSRLEREIPEAQVPYSAGKTAGQWYHEAEIVGDVYMAAGIRDADADMVAKGEAVKKRGRERARDYYRYYTSVEPERRKALKHQTRQEALYYDHLLKGGDRQ